MTSRPDTPTSNSTTQTGQSDSENRAAGAVSEQTQTTSSLSNRRAERTSSSHGSSRSRSRSPYRQSRHHRRRRFRLKHKERNFFAAVSSMIVIVILSTAIAEPNWFYVRGGGCTDATGIPLHTLGVYQFFYPGHFETSDTSLDSKTLNQHQTGKDVEPLHSYIGYHYGPHPSNLLVNCVTPRMVQVMRSIIALCFIGIAFSLMAFFLDLSGPSTRILKILRRNAVFNILTVVVCVTINGFSFLITQLLEVLQNDTKSHHFSKVEIRFDVSFYLIAVAGALSVIASAFNLLRRHITYEHTEQQDSLLSDFDDMHMHLPPCSPDYPAPMTFLPPPPAYTP